MDPWISSLFSGFNFPKNKSSKAEPNIIAIYWALYTSPAFFQWRGYQIFYFIDKDCIQSQVFSSYDWPDLEAGIDVANKKENEGGRTSKKQ